MNTPAIPDTYKGSHFRHYWHYNDWFLAARYDAPDGSKAVVPYSLNSFKHWERGIPKMIGLLPLFGINSCEPDRPILIVEGEKCAAALHQLGFAAVTSLGGADSPHKSDWHPVNGWIPRVIILPDNNAPGEKYAHGVARLLSGQPRVLRLEGLPEGGDIVDWIQREVKWTPWAGQVFLVAKWIAMAWGFHAQSPMGDCACRSV